MKYFIRRLVIVFSAVFGIITFAMSQDIPSFGKEFHLTFYRNGSFMSGQDSSYRIYVTSNKTTTGSVKNTNTGWTFNFSILAGKVQRIDVPLGEAYNTLENVVSNKGLVITSLDTLSVFAMNTFTATSDATLVLQKDALGSNYYVMAYTGINNSLQFTSAACIQATENNTQIQITPTAALIQGTAANVPFTITLNQGQTYFFNSLNDLSGTKIEVTNGCKKIAVFSGATGAQVPMGQVAADHLLEQMFPAESYGQQFITPKYLGRNTSRVKIFAPSAATEVKVDGQVVTTLAAGAVYEYFTLNKEQFIETSKPVMVCLFANGNAFDNANGPVNAGDPSMMLIQPIEQKILSATFISPNAQNVTSHRVSVVCKTADLSTMQFNGNNIGNQFVPLAGNINFSTASFYVPTNSHVFSNIYGFNAYAYGFGNAQGYSYNVGTSVSGITNHFTCNGYSSANTDTVKVCTNVNSQFIVLAQQPGATFNWNFGDGTPIVTTPGNVVNQPHSFSTSGIYTVTLTISNVCNGANIVRRLVVWAQGTIAPTGFIDMNPTVAGCPGQNLSFRITAQNAGINPTYQWLVNGTAVAGNVIQFSSTTINNGDTVKCIITSNLPCAMPQSVTVAKIVIFSNANIPTVNITSNTTTVCAGTPINFTAALSYTAIVNYQWKVNGMDQGTNSSSFSYTPNHNDVVTCVISLTNMTCGGTLTSTSNSLMATVLNNNSSPTVAIQVSAMDTCAGTPITFTAAGTNLLANTVYTWYVNNTATTASGATFTSSTLQNGDQVFCIVEVTAVCISQTRDTSNVITLNVLPNIVPTISLVSNRAAYCIGDTADITATITNGGNNPNITWFVNNVSVATGASLQYRLYNIQGSTSVYAVLNSTVKCAVQAVNSVVLTINITPYSNAATILSVSKNPICIGEGVQFTAAVSNGGTNPIYQWYLNNQLQSNNTNSLSLPSPKQADSVKVVVTGNASSCVVPVGSNTVTITVWNLPQISFSNNDTTIAFGTQFQLQPIITGNSIASYLWSPSAALSATNIKSPIVRPPSNDIYKLEVVDVNGCRNSNTIKVNVFKDLLLPSVFTPNGDGVNDVFTIGTNFPIEINRFEICDRWGKLIYSSRNPAQGWDGRFKSKLAPVGTYVWLIVYKNPILKSIVTKKGTISLLR